MSNLHKAAEMALEYFEDAHGLEDAEVAIKEALRQALTPEVPCKTHPDAPHGFDRNASHNANRYVCECEGWEPPQREWVNLTPTEFNSIKDTATTIGYAIIKTEAMLKEKNT
jgi:hypothetical protein